LNVKTSRYAGSLGSGSLPELPTLVLLLDKVKQELTANQELGLLSITVLGREGTARGPDSWAEYDAILKEISFFLAGFTSSRLRKTDILLDPVVAGNTFVLLIGPPRDGRPLDQTDLTLVRERLVRGVARQLKERLPGHREARYGIHVGGALIRHDAEVDCSRIIYRGLDQAFADALGQRKEEGLRHAVHLQRILKEGQVAAVYQPLVDLVDCRVIGYEALTRLPHGQFQTPDVLFKVAQENGALWALERLCRRRALESMPRLEPDQKLFLNIEPDSFHDPELCRRAFRDLLDESGLRPGQLVLELTEHAAVTDFAAMRRTLDTLRTFGFRLAMDDVGSGYSGLRAIAEIRPDFLKVDMSLVRGLHLDPIKRELIETIRRFSDSTGILLVAEGVEAPEELESLADAGVRCAQGFLFARPDSPPRQPDWPRLARLLRGSGAD